MKTINQSSRLVATILLILAVLSSSGCATFSEVPAATRRCASCSKEEFRLLVRLHDTLNSFIWYDDLGNTKAGVNAKDWAPAMTPRDSVPSTRPLWISLVQPEKTL